MQIDLYKKAFEAYFSDNVNVKIAEGVAFLRNAERLWFIGNGGSSAICSHMMEDFMKIARIPTLSFTDPALITCFANDYGYENAMAEWVSFNFQSGDVLVAISSSGESKNILNAVDRFAEKGGKVMTLSGFKQGNALSEKGDLNFHIAEENYGVVECFHQVILHAILDEIAL
ncbi:MAG: SIS domain-containing protein [Cryomorphaceae bacterium]|nr:SIS domain-containing protein [Flavobacteriales bacterium]